MVAGPRRLGGSGFAALSLPLNSHCRMVMKCDGSGRGGLRHQEVHLMP